MKFTFSEEVKTELCQVEVLSVDEARAEFAGYLSGRGELLRTNRETWIKLELGIVAAARRIMTIFGKLGIDRGKMTLVQKKMKRRRVQFFVPDEILDKLGVSVFEVPSFLGTDVGFVGAFLRGVFVACGSLTDPAKHYHFEVISANEQVLRFLERALAELVGIFGSVGKFGDKRLRYFVKRGRDILDLLELMGASRASSYYSRIVNSREIKSDINRSLNFISANAKRSGESAARQIEAINFIDERIGLERLPSHLKRLAIVRLEHADIPLEELGKLLDPPLTKSMVYTRLMKLQRIADLLRSLDKSEINSKIIYAINRIGAVDGSRSSARKVRKPLGNRGKEVGG